MPSYSLHELTPTLSFYTYWRKKEVFMLYEDCYKEWTIFAVEDGMLYFEIGEQKGTASYGDILFCPPHTPFRRVIVEPLDFHFIRVVWSTESGQPAEPPETMPAGKITLQNTERLAANYHALQHAPPYLAHNRNHRINHYIRDLWYMYCAEFEPEAELEELKDEFMQMVLKLIHLQAFNPLNFKEIAAEVGISPVQLSKRFKAAFGQTPIAYLTNLRMEKAGQLLLETQLTVDQIAQCCGYENGFYLSRIFTKHQHMSPSEYRKVHRI